MSDVKTNVPTKPTSRRSVKNYALQPKLQIKFGVYSIISAIIFTLTIAAILYFNLAKLTTTIIELTGVEDEVRALVDEYVAPAKLELLAALVAYVAISIYLSIRYTHRLVGPTIAFRRHIRMIADEQWDYKTTLRDGDAFSEVAEDLNRLSIYLGKKYGGTKK